MLRKCICSQSTYTHIRKPTLKIAHLLQKSLREMSRLTRSCSLLKRKNKKLYYEYIDFLLAREILDINSYWFFFKYNTCSLFIKPFCWQLACINKCASARDLSLLLKQHYKHVWSSPHIIIWGHFLRAVPKDITQRYLWEVMTCNCPLAGHPSSVAHRYYRLRPPVQSYDDASHCNPIRLIHYFSVPRSFVPKLDRSTKPFTKFLSERGLIMKLLCG